MARTELTFFNELEELDSRSFSGYITSLKSKHKKCNSNISLFAGYDGVYEVTAFINLAENNRSMASIQMFFEPPQWVILKQKPNGEKFTCVYEIGIDRESDKYGFLKEMLKEKQFEKTDKPNWIFDVYEKVDGVDCNKSVNDYIEKVKSLTTKFLDYIEYIVETEQTKE